MGPWAYIDTPLPLLRAVNAPRSYRVVLSACASHAAPLSLATNESYALDVSRDGTAVVTAAEVTGVVRAVETLTQLVHYDGSGWVLPNLPIHVADEPRFAWRGLLIDPARHFLPVPDVLRTIDGMAGACAPVVCRV